MISIQQCLDKISQILLININEFNTISLNQTFQDFANSQDFSNLHILEPGNEHLFEQWCFNNNISTENRCKRLKPYDIHKNNITLLEYKLHVEGGLQFVPEELITLTFHNLLNELELKLNKSFKLTSKVAQDRIFTQSILQYFTYLEEQNNIELIEYLKNILNNGGNNLIKTLVFNHTIIREYYHDLLTGFHEYINTVISRLDNIPEIEQKTDAWFKLRANMISASICGYMDGYVSGAGIGKEHEKVKEKAGITGKKVFSMGSGPLKHGILFEDVTGDIYDSLNGLISKEYGILPDYRYSEIGASPDGIIIDFKNNKGNKVEGIDILRKCKYGRMREIKNPTSRSITNNKIPNYYYYQMLQQMYVCDLPYCDFIQTSISYPDTNMNLDEQRQRNFFIDTFNVSNLDSVSTFKDLYKYLSSYIIQKIDWYNGIMSILKKKPEFLEANNIFNLEELILKKLKKKWRKFCSIPLCNLTKSGKIKGIFWYYTKGERDTLEYKYCWTPLSEEITYDAISHITHDNLVEWVKEGYSLCDKYYFTVDVYQEKEIEYNQVMYENALSRLLKKWELVLNLRSIIDIEQRLEEFNRIYQLGTNSKQSKIFKDMKSFKTVDKPGDILRLNLDTTESLLGLTTKKKSKFVKKKNKPSLNVGNNTNLDIVNATNNDDDIFNLD